MRSRCSRAVRIRLVSRPSSSSPSRRRCAFTSASVNGSAAGGAIKLEISGEKQIRSLKIAPEAIDPEDVEMLEDMLVAAFNEAVKKVDDMTSTEMSKVTGGMNLPKGMF